MAAKPKKPCAFPGCRTLCRHRHCDAHHSIHVAGRTEDIRRDDNRRPSSTKRGYDRKWYALVKSLRGDPQFATCAECARLGMTRPTDVFDHITPLAAGGARLDRRNIQALCTGCHNAKTARERKNVRANKR